MAIYVGESSFSKLEKATEHAKAMIESWTMDTREFKDSSRNFNPALPVNTMNNNSIGNYQSTKDDYQKYSWLFGGTRV